MARLDADGRRLDTGGLLSWYGSSVARFQRAGQASRLLVVQGE